MKLSLRLLVGYYYLKVFSYLFRSPYIPIEKPTSKMYGENGLRQQLYSCTAVQKQYLKISTSRNVHVQIDVQIAVDHRTSAAVAN